MHDDQVKALGRHQRRGFPRFIYLAGGFAMTTADTVMWTFVCFSINRNLTKLPRYGGGIKMKPLSGHPHMMSLSR